MIIPGESDHPLTRAAVDCVDRTPESLLAAKLLIRGPDPNSNRESRVDKQRDGCLVNLRQAGEGIPSPCEDRSVAIGLPPGVPDPAESIPRTGKRAAIAESSTVEALGNLPECNFDRRPIVDLGAYGHAGLLQHRNAASLSTGPDAGVGHSESSGC